jgi:hypothetical protein
LSRVHSAARGVAAAVVLVAGQWRFCVVTAAICRRLARVSTFLRGREFGELWLEHAEFVALRIAQDPELKSAFFLVIPARGTESFKAAYFGFDIVGLHVEVHSFLGGLRVAGLLQENSYL